MPEVNSFGGNERISGTWIHGVLVQPGSPVRLRPSDRSDPEQRTLWGRSAAIDRIEVDFEGRVVVSVVLDREPGAEGEPGRRLYYRAEEIEPLPLPERRDP
jgi:hypothetical protein